MNVITIDLEDWYHCLDENPANWHKYEDRVVPAVRQLLRILKTTGTQSTLTLLSYRKVFFPSADSCQDCFSLQNAGL